MSVPGRVQTRLEHRSLPQFTLYCLCNRSTVITALYIRKLECRGINLSAVSSNSLLLTLSWRDLSKCDLSGMCCHVFNEFCSRRINQMVIDSGRAYVVRNARGTDLFIRHINIYFLLPSVQALLSSVHGVSSEKPSSRGGRVHANMWKALTEAAQAFGDVGVLRVSRNYSRMFQKCILISKHLFWCRSGGCVPLNRPLIFKWDNSVCLQLRCV